MSVGRDHSPSVVVYVNGSYPQDEPVRGQIKSGVLSGPQTGQMSVSDPYQLHRNFPKRWQSYLHDTYRNAAHVRDVFRVDDRTARKWWKGETGCVGGYVAVAFNLDPQGVSEMLMAAG